MIINWNKPPQTNRDKLLEVLRLLRDYPGTPLVAELVVVQRLLQEMLKDTWREPSEETNFMMGL